MPVSTPVPTKVPGDVFSDTMWNSYLRDNLNKLLTLQHRVLTVAQFGALTSPEGTKGTTPPDEVYLEVDSTNGVLWHLAYESGETTYKWRFLGGPALYSAVATSETRGSATYGALTTAGPAITLPKAGDYDVEIGCKTGRSSGAADANAYMSYDIGATTAVDGDSVWAQFDQQDTVAHEVVQNPWRKKRKTALTAVALTAKYRTTSTEVATFAERTMYVTPIRIQHT